MSIIVSDNFTRGDNPATMGNAPTGQTWVPALNTWGILSNAAFMNIVDVPFAVNQGFAIVDAGSPNTISQVKILNAAAAGGLGLSDQGLVFRWFSDQWFWQVVYSTALGTLRLMEARNGFQGSVDGFATALADGDVIKAVCCGSDIAIYLNDVQVMSGGMIPLPDPTILGGTFYGLESATSTATFDDFLVETNDVCPTSPSPSLSPSESPSASPSTTPSSSPSASPENDDCVTDTTKDSVYIVDPETGEPLLAGATLDGLYMIVAHQIFTYTFERKGFQHTPFLREPYVLDAQKYALGLSLLTKAERGQIVKAELSGSPESGGLGKIT